MTLTTAKIPSRSLVGFPTVLFDASKPRPSPVCYHAEFGRFRSNRARISRGEPPKLGSAGMEGVTDLKTSLSHVLSRGILSFYIEGCICK